jgi:hypothetical protein
MANPIGKVVHLGAYRNPLPSEPKSTTTNERKDANSLSDVVPAPRNVQSPISPRKRPQLSSQRNPGVPRSSNKIKREKSLQHQHVRINIHKENIHEDPSSESDLSGSTELDTPSPEQSLSLSKHTEEHKAVQQHGFGKKLLDLIPRIKKEKKPPSYAEQLFKKALKEIKNNGPRFDRNDDMAARVRKANEPVESKDINAANANALEAFGMSFQEAFYNLRISDLYNDALTGDNGDLCLMTPTALEGYLKLVLNDPNARKAAAESKLTPTEAVAIRFYGLEGFQNVQPALRGKPDPAQGTPNLPAEVFTNLVKECQSGFAKLPPLPSGQMLFRGTNFFDHGLPGDVYEDPAFVSTSLEEEIAKGKFEGSYLLKFDASSEAACRNISALTGNPTEAEVLFLPNTQFRIESLVPGAEGEPTVVRLRPL